MRSTLSLCFVLVSCTAIRPLEAPGDSGGIDAAADAASVDAPTDACGAVDTCDGTDDDCNPATPDGSGDPLVGVECDGADADLCPEGVSVCSDGDVDCSDATGDLLETCDGTMDEDCDGSVDEDGAVGGTTYYPDADMDAAGDGSMPRIACVRPEGSWVIRNDDCDDADPDVRPGRPEICNARDDDCDGDLDDGASCPANCEQSNFELHSYQVCEQSMSWDDAQAACMSFGYHLVVIETAAENDFVRTATQGVPAFQGAWIGLRDSGAGFAWLDGTPVTFSAWEPTEPNGTGPCARMRGMLASGRWADFACGNGIAFVCEAP